MNMTQLFVGPIIANIINTCLDYMKDQLFGQTSMKEVLERLQKRLPIIRSVVSAYYQTQIRDQDPALDGWIWQLRDAIDEADDLLDEFAYMKHKEQISKNLENKNVFSNTNFLLESAHEILKVGERALNIDPNMKRLEEVVQNLDKVSAELILFWNMREINNVMMEKWRGRMLHFIMPCLSLLLILIETLLSMRHFFSTRCSPVIPIGSLNLNQALGIGGLPKVIMLYYYLDEDGDYVIEMRCSSFSLSTT